jgi:hypothetical protein
VVDACWAESSEYLPLEHELAIMATARSAAIAKRCGPMAFCMESCLRMLLGEVRAKPCHKPGKCAISHILTQDVSGQLD